MTSRRRAFWSLILAVCLLAVALTPLLAQDADEAEVWLPDQLTSELQVKAAFNGQDFFWLFEWPAQPGSFYHDYLVYEDGAWKRRGDSGGGGDALGLREDRVTFMVDPGTVQGFANQGCYVTCHSGMASLSDEVDGDTIEAALGDAREWSEIRKYITASRAGVDWWEADWDTPKSVEEIEALAAAGVFLDLWHWRAHRSNPINYSDDQFVLDYRDNDPGRGPFTTNWNGDTSQPNFMYDPDKVGFAALEWDTLNSRGYGMDDIYYLSADMAMPYDPDYAWENGDTLPRRLLREPQEGMAEIAANGRWENGMWRVELQRAMDTGSAGDHALIEGRTYNIGFATHKNATGSRWHYISLPIKVGVGTPAAVSAVRFEGATPNWESIPAVTVPMFYPAEVTWDWLIGDAHPGSPEVRADSRSCASCHGDDASALVKLSQAGVYHETTDGQSALNWWLTLAATVTLLVGGTVIAMNVAPKNLTSKKER